MHRGSTVRLGRALVRGARHQAVGAAVVGTVGIVVGVVAGIVDIVVIVVVAGLRLEKRLQQQLLQRRRPRHHPPSLYPLPAPARAPPGPQTRAEFKRARLANGDRRGQPVRRRRCRSRSQGQRAGLWGGGRVAAVGDAQAGGALELICKPPTEVLSVNSYTSAVTVSYRYPVACD